MQTRIEQLILKHQKGKLTLKESIELNEFKARSKDNRQLVDNLTDAQHLFGAIKRSRALDIEAELQKARTELGLSEPTISKARTELGGLSEPTISKARYSYWIAAAVVVIVIGLTWPLISKKSGQKEPYARKEHHASPYHQARLTLSNGQVFNLHELKNGSLGEDTMVTKNDSQLFYPANYQPNQSGMNTLETQKGSYYTLQLSDGSRVWLNAASSIQYPTSFKGAKRIVRVQGEVYFEVAKNPAQPFIVQTALGTEVYVTGTRFTVNAYKGDSTVRTTLLEGSVKITGKDFTDSLQPGEQAIATVGRKFQKIKVVDHPEQRVLGWKANKFTWMQTDLKTILEDLSHWYGYQLSYKTDVPSTTYNFTLDRTEPLDTIFKVLRKGTGLDFKLEGRTTIAIYP